MSNLKTIRKSINLTQKDLAKDIGHTPASVGHYEAGRRSPDVDTCHLIIGALKKRGMDVTFEDIFPHTSAAVGGIDNAKGV